MDGKEDARNILKKCMTGNVVLFSTNLTNYKLMIDQNNIYFMFLIKSKLFFQ